MGLMYSASFGGSVVSAALDLFALSAPSDAIVVVHGVRLGQTSDAGDAQAELLRVDLARVAAVGSGGGTLTPAPHQVGLPAAGSSVRNLDTTQAAAPAPVLRDAWNVQAGWLYLPTPEERIVLSPSGILVVSLPAAPADAITVSGSITFEEIGG